MIQPLVKDIILLSKKSVPASRADLKSVTDLIDTLNYHHETCVGMAGNMIGIQKRIMAIKIGMISVPLINPKIISHSNETYQTEEGCLCLEGVRPVTRYESITVEYQDLSLKKQARTFAGFTAQIIQHELDHFDGIIV